MIPTLFTETPGITWRAAAAAVVAFAGCLALGPRVIRWLRSRKIEDPVSKHESERLDELMAAKKRTPTMGGAFVLAGVLAAVVFLADAVSPAVPVVAVAALLLGLMGMIDDYMKLRGRRGGLRMFPKLMVQCVIGLAIGLAVMFVLLQSNPEHATRIWVPFTGGGIDLGAWFPLYAMVVVVATCNAVNITDGLDGLAPGCLAIAFFAFGLVAYAVGRVDFSAHIGLPYVPAAAELTVVCAAAFGAALGFLWFNCHPAQVFMGDSGSQSLGGVLAAVALLTKQELLLFAVGGVFVIEGGSSLIQIVYFKLTRKRVFRCAPLHHHFQFGGVPETRIVMRLWILAAVLAISSLAALKL